ncbi:MAG: DUF3817 domain-containing protein [Microbacterium sp.]|uniref:DUF3817 domain-containing protein n=1 Tax=Microbacterium sp. TaxID=51671 RepID=UPI0039E33F11
MPPAPKLALFPAIRRALRFYQVCSAITGTFLLLLCAEMIVKYGFGYELFLGGSGGIAWWAPVIEGPQGHVSTGDGLNVSMTVLIVHGWFYVVYLFSCFRIWSLMRWPFWRFLLLASGGIVPFLSFIMEAIVARDVKRHLAEREADVALGDQLAGHSTLTSSIPIEGQR